MRGALVAILALMAVELFVLSAPKPPFDDFIVYWAAGRLNARGDNPYDAALVLAEQQLVGWREPIAYRVWYPPWSVAVMAPFALPSYQWGRFLWYLALGAVFVWSVDALWTIYGSENPLRRVAAQLLALAFWPTIVVWKTGQATPLVLLGLVAFLVCHRRGRPFAAGAALAFAALKPQVPILLWPLLALWVLAERRWMVAAGFATAMALLTAAAAATNPGIVMQYAGMLRHDPPYNEPSTVGTALRLWFQSYQLPGAAAVQFVPLACGLVWAALHFWRTRGAWRWTDELPLVCVLSLLTTPWCWIYDEVLLLIPVIQLAGRFERSAWDARRRLVVGAFGLACAAVLVMNVAEARAYDYIWTMPAFSALYLISLAGQPTHALAHAA